MLWLDCTQGDSRLFLDVRPPAGEVVHPAERFTAWWRMSVIRWAAQILVPLGLTAPAGPAQASQVPRVGILSPYAASASSFQDDIKRGLTELGYVEGKTVLYESRFADGRTDHLPALAADLMQRKVDILVTATAPAVRAAMQATTAIPIVVGDVDDAVEQGFVASLARPGGNVTGTSWLNAELSGKRLEVLKQALPGLSHIAVLREAVGGGPMGRAVVAAARALGVHVSILELRAPNELDDVFAEMTRIGVGALYVLQSPMIMTEARRIAHLASQRRIPAIFPDRRFVEAGGLMSYGPSLPDMYRRATTYIDRILRGAKPADLPVEQPTVFELVINNRAARSLGLTLSEAIVVRADEVIE
jgi:putative ABC transport system substrate-binding protein